MDFKLLIPRLLEDTVNSTGLLYTDQQVNLRKGDGGSYHPFNGNLFLFKKGEIIVGSVGLRDGQKIQVQLPRATQDALRSLEGGLTIEQLCISGAITVKRQANGFSFSMESGAPNVMPRFILRTEKVTSSKTSISTLGYSDTKNRKERMYEYRVNGRTALEQYCGHDEYLTANGRVYKKFQVTEWLEETLESYWTGARIPGSPDKFAIPPAYWGSKDREEKTDMRIIIARQIHAAAKKMAADNGVKFTLPEPTQDFEGFWERCERQIVAQTTTFIPPPPKVIVPAPPVIIVSAPPPPVFVIPKI